MQVCVLVRLEMHNASKEDAEEGKNDGYSEY